MKGVFITFEGPEKSGKSTQSKLLKRYLTRKGLHCLCIREPGSTVLSERIRRVLLDKRNGHLSHETEMLLYMAARSQLVKEIIRPALEKGTVVICDRFLDSTIAYQGYGLGMDKKIISTVGAFATQGISPDITFLLDMNSKHSSFKQMANKDRIESRSAGYHRRVRKGYFCLAKKYPRRIKVIRVKKDRADTQQEIRNIIDGYLARQK